MKGLLFTLFIFPLIVYSQSNLPYKLGEHSVFSISFGGITVGGAELKIQSQTTVDGISAFHIIGKGKTNSFFDFFLLGSEPPIFVSLLSRLMERLLLLDRTCLFFGRGVGVGLILVWGFDLLFTHYTMSE